MDRLEILHLHAIPEDILIRLATNGDIPHQVFDEDRILVGLFGDMFFIGTLQQAEKLGAGGLLGKTHHIFNPHRLFTANRECHMPTLVMRTSRTDRLGARAEGGHRHDGGDNKIHLAVFEGRAEADGVIHQADRSAHGCFFTEKKRKFDFEMCATALEPPAHLLEDVADVFHMDHGTMFRENLDESTHVGAFEMMRQVDRELNGSDRALNRVLLVAHLQRVAQPLLKHPDQKLVQQQLRQLKVIQERLMQEIVNIKCLRMDGLEPEDLKSL